MLVQQRSEAGICRYAADQAHPGYPKSRCRRYELFYSIGKYRLLPTCAKIFHRKPRLLPSSVQEGRFEPTKAEIPSLLGMGTGEGIGGRVALTGKPLYLRPPWIRQPQGSCDLIKSFAYGVVNRTTEYL